MPRPGHFDKFSGLPSNGPQSAERSPFTNEKFIVRLTEAEREQLAVPIRRGEGNARKLIRARILLKAEMGILGPAWTDDQIATIFDVSTLMSHRVRQGFFELGLDATPTRRTSGYHELVAIGRHDELSVR